MKFLMAAAVTALFVLNANVAFGAEPVKKEATASKPAASAPAKPAASAPAKAEPMKKKEKKGGC